MLLVHLFVCLVRISFCHFSLPLGVGGSLRFMIVAPPRFSSNFFLYGTINRTIEVLQLRFRAVT